MRYLTIAEFFTNIIRGILLIAFAKYLFDYTEQLWSIALIFVVDSLVSFVIPLFIGQLVDKLGSHRVLNGSSFCLAATLTLGVFASDAYGVDTALVFSIAILFNVITPFIRMSVFTITPEITKMANLTSANSKLQMAVQAGQLVGLAIVAMIMKYYGFKDVLNVTAIASLMAMVCYYIASRGIIVPHSNKKQIKLMTAISAISNRPIMFLLLAASLDVVLVAIFNLFLTPWVSLFYEGKPEVLSSIDAMYALGAILAGAVVVKLFASKTLSPWVAVASQFFALATFLLFAVEAPTFLRFLSILMFGVACTLSVIYFNAFIQKHAPNRIKGRVVGIRRVFISIYITVGTFLISYAYTFTYESAISTAMIIAVINIAFLCLWLAKAGDTKSITRFSTIYAT